jgi:alkylation response protein AidB-like acyl-CoA dehydrogenase
MSLTATERSPQRARERAASAHVPQELLDQLTLRFAASAADYDRRAVFPQENFEALHEAGLLGLTVAEEFGGRGAGLGEALRVLAAVARGEPSTALILFMTYGYYAGTFARTDNWPRALYARLARQAASEIALIGGLRVEPELGTPVRGGMPKTTAELTPDGYRITGRKIYSTGSTGLSWFAVWAKTDEPEPRVGSFLVSRNAPGVHIEPAWDHLGMRATVSHEVVFEGTPIPREHALDVRAPAAWAPKPGESATTGIWNALAISTIYNGVALAARDWLAGYLKERVPSNLGAPLASLPRVQEKFGEIEALLYANAVLIRDATRRAEQEKPPSSVESNLVKHLVSKNAIRAVELGLELTGNPGLSKRNPLERHYRDVLCSRIHSPQDDTILVAAGKSGFGG